MSRIHEYVGEKSFYTKASRIALPMMLQGGIYNLIGLLNNIMVGRVSTVQMNGVAVVNQLMFVFYSCISGIFAGIGVFTAQFSGKGDDEGIRFTFRFKLITSFLLSAATILLLGIWGRLLIQSYLNGEGLAADAEASLFYGMGYLWIMLAGVPPYALINVYSSTLRELGQTKVPMISCVLSMMVSLALNYVLIFGFWGIPAMGCYGAAIATLIARFIELAGVAGWTHLNARGVPFIRGAYRSLHIPGWLALRIVKKSAPFALNQLLWSMGVAAQTQCYSVRGLHVVSANSIVSTLSSLIIVAATAVGNTARIVIGHMMGRSEDPGKILAVYRKFIGLCFASSLVVSLLYALAGRYFPLIYNTTGEVRELASSFILISALILPFTSYLTVVSGVLHTGGNASLTLIFDTVFIWLACVVPAGGLVHFTGLGILWIYGFCQCTEILKTGLGMLLIKKGRWIQNVVDRA
jgi:putative MATE family efflux protein